MPDWFHRGSAKEREVGIGTVASAGVLSAEAGPTGATAVSPLGDCPAPRRNDMVQGKWRRGTAWHGVTGAPVAFSAAAQCLSPPKVPGGVTLSQAGNSGTNRNGDFLPVLLLKPHPMLHYAESCLLRDGRFSRTGDAVCKFETPFNKGAGMLKF